MKAINEADEAGGQEPIKTGQVIGMEIVDVDRLTRMAVVSLAIRVTQTLGAVSRTHRHARGVRSILGRGAGRAVRTLAPLLDAEELRYHDLEGYIRRAHLRDHLETEGFLGLGRLPAAVRAQIGVGDWVVDVGANVGLVTGQLCSLVGPTGHVWAIEPIPRNQARLHELRTLNGLDARLTVIEGALGNETGEADIKLPQGGDSGWASFGVSWITGPTVRTRTWRLDDLLDERREEGRIAFLKIDVEGFEPQVLMGATRTLRKMRPTVLCEFNDVVLRDVGCSSRELLRQFGAIGYSPITPLPDLDGRLVDLLLVPA